MSSLVHNSSLSSWGHNYGKGCQEEQMEKKNILNLIEYKVGSTFECFAQENTS